MRSVYVTAGAALALTPGCGSTSAAQVEIAAHYVPACAPAEENAPTQLELIALGDFDRDNDSVAILRSDAVQSNVTLPPGTRAAELNTLGDGAFWGSGTLDPHNQLPILLWPRNRACTLARIEADGLAGDWLLGASDRLETLLVAGGSTTGEAALALSLANADGAVLGAMLGPRVPRIGATLSELGDGLLLAGGLDATNGTPQASAERFDPALGRFTGLTDELSVPRARHAALGLGTGSSLLIGGETEGGAALRSVEVVTLDSPRFSRVFELLATPRIEPRAVLLGGDRILVGGGYERAGDGSRTPLASVELLSTDFTDVTEPPILLEPPALGRAFAALGRGGALAVGGCELGASATDCIACEGGCVSHAVWWIDPQGTAHELDPLPSALAVAEPRLVSGAGGSPWLLAAGRVGHFDPWQGRFELVDVGRPNAATLVGDAVAIRPGLFAWLEATPDGVEVVGFYHNQRGPLSQDVAPLLVGSGQNVVPHRPPVTDDPSVRLGYDTAVGLELSGPAAVVSVADTEYASFTLELSLASGPPPLLKLVGASSEDDAAFGGIECPWPDVESSEVAGGRPFVVLRVERALDRVRLTLDGASEGTGTEGTAAEPCVRALPERVGIQLVGTPAGVTRLSRIEIRRELE